MDTQMRLYWETFSEFYTTKEIIRLAFNPLRDFEDELTDGAIVDFGCGQASFLLDYAGKGKRLIGVDNDNYQLEQLQLRFEELAASENHLILQNLDIFNDQLPQEHYAAVFLANIMHFFNLEDCGRILAKIEAQLSAGSFIYISVHSDQYYANNTASPTNNDYFKHYFTLADLDNLFPSERYERLFYAHIERSSTKKERNVKEVWVDKFLDHNQIQPGKLRDMIRTENTSDHPQNDRICVYRLL